MTRLLTLLMIFALAITNGAAVTAAMCQHENAFAHAAALQSADESVSRDAVSEEAAAAAASKKGFSSDGAASVASYIVPNASLHFPPPVLDSTSRRMTDAAGLGSRSVPPLLEPPLA